MNTDESAEARVLLGDAADKLRAVLQDEAFMAETPVEVEAAECAVVAIDTALRRLDSAAPVQRSSAAPPPGGPTRQQGQFLAYIREYMMGNQAGVAPSHADFQRFFNLTPPSVNPVGEFHADPARTAGFHPAHPRQSAGHRTHH